MRFYYRLPYSHVQVEQVGVIDEESPCQVAGEVSDWGYQVGSVTFLLMCQDHWNAYYRPGGWGCRVALTHTLIFYCCYFAAHISPNVPWGISIACAKEESKVLQCFKHSSDRTSWHTKRLEDHRCHWVADSIVAVVGVYRG